MLEDICQWSKECKNQATRIASKKEGPILDICDKCWYREFKS